jgi:chromosome partitioning protein
MSTPTIAFFNAQAGVGTTSLVYHLAWMYQGLGLRVLAIDLDPQATLTTMLLEDERLLDIWETSDSLEDSQAERLDTVARCLKSLVTEKAKLVDPLLKNIAEGFELLSGDLSLAAFEYDVSLTLRDADSGGFAVALKSLVARATENSRADVVLLDLGANCGAINRSAFMVADYYITPLNLDLASLQGVKCVKLAVADWQQQWQRITAPFSSDIKSLGYVVQQDTTERSVSDYSHWQVQVTQINRDSMLSNPWLAILKDHRSLMPMAIAAKKPIFQLKPADGTIGAYSQAVRKALEDFRQLAQKIAQLTQIKNWPTESNHAYDYLLESEYKDLPKDLPLRILEKGTRLFRIHSIDLNALYFNRSNNSRFSSPDGEYGILYAGMDDIATFLAIFGDRLANSQTLDLEALESMRLSQFCLQRNLRLVDLTGAGLALIGGDARVITGSYQLSQSWSQTLYHHEAKIDGIYYRSRHDPSRFCVALYENRLIPTDLQVQRVTPHDLLDSSFAATIQRISDAYGYQLLDDNDE